MNLKRKLTRHGKGTNRPLAVKKDTVNRRITQMQLLTSNDGRRYLVSFHATKGARTRYIGMAR